LDGAFEVFVSLLWTSGLIVGALIFAVGWRLGSRARERDEMMRLYYERPHLLRARTVLGPLAPRHPADEDEFAPEDGPTREMSAVG
jgi:hypothetical protein